MDDIKLIMPFVDQSPSYARGFEAGGIWARLSDGKDIERIIVRIENQQQYESFAKYFKKAVVYEDSGVTGWLYMTMKAIMPEAIRLSESTRERWSASIIEENERKYQQKLYASLVDDVWELVREKLHGGGPDGIDLDAINVFISQYVTDYIESREYASVVKPVDVIWTIKFDGQKGHFDVDHFPEELRKLKDGISTARLYRPSEENLATLIRLKMAGLSHLR